METSPGLFRSALQPSHRRTLLIALGGAATTLALGLGIGHVIGERSMSVLPVVTPVVVEAPKVPAPVVNVPAQAAPIVNVNVPPPSAPPAPPAPHVHVPVPHLDAACFMGGTTGCGWGDGFPAISADGALIAHQRSDPDPTVGESLSILFLDASTGRLVRRAPLYTAEENNLFPDHDGQINSYELKDNPEGLERAQREAAKKISWRVKTVQRELEQRGFRAMRWLGSGEEPSSQDSTEAPATPPPAAPIERKHVYAEFHGTAARLVDPARGVELWRSSFSVDSPGYKGDGSDFCGPNYIQSVQLWWDPTTRVVLASKGYRAVGGCMCHGGVQEEVLRIPASAFAEPAAQAQ